MNYREVLRNMPTMEKIRRVRAEMIREKYEDYCTYCNCMTDIKQVERDECCLEVCSICDREYEPPF